ncbi:MAG: Crp/Fnr family transcriptional regulator [Capnocytophaga sp.]|nr:Crp/Fnr family transcriptional regulator [Capnocytophaga sp.]
MTTPLLNHITKIIPLNAEEKALIGECFASRLYRRKQYVLQEGDVCQALYFVVSGCLRMYKIDEKGNTHIVQFAPENAWIANIGSLHSQTPSEFSIDAVEDTMVLLIKQQDLYKLFKQVPKFNIIFRVLTEQAYMKLQQRMMVSISSTAEQKYQYFAKTYPHLLNRLPQTQIAAFLGITPVMLSNVKASLLRGGK